MGNRDINMEKLSDIEDNKRGIPYHTESDNLYERKNVSYGILGGTFNPIHNAHIELATAALKQFHLDKVLLMPNNKPAYKSLYDIVSNEDRAEMVKLAVQGIDGLEFSDMELNRPGLTYTCDTLKLLNMRYPQTEWYFIMGGDSIMYFDKWKEPEKIVRYATLIVSVRNDIDKTTIHHKIEELQSKYSGCRILFEEIEAVDISSSMLRKMINMNEDVSSYMDKRVVDYIKDRQLYMINEGD